MTDQERIKELRDALNVHNYKYYVLNSPEISDQDFDFMMHELQRLEALHPEMFDPNSPSQRVGSDISNNFVQREHRYPMLSLANTYNENDVREWYESVDRGLGGQRFDVCCELKFDGLSISLTYQKGQLVRALTRGDGVRGDDVTANVRTIRTIPLTLPAGDWPDEFEVRGEVLMPWSQFDRLNSEREQSGEALFANPRNAASGTLKSKDSRVVASRGLDAYLYFVLGDQINGESHYSNLQRIASWGFKTGHAIKLLHSIDEIMEFISYWGEHRRELPIATDGIVLKVDSLRQQQMLGSTAKNPRWAIAYKYKAEREETQLLSVSYQVGRTGAITPVANMSPVLLAGTTVKRATLNNADFIANLDLHVGDYVYIEKGGEIIPKIVGVNTARRVPGMCPVRFITNCPECGTPLVRYEGEAAYYCPSDATCPPQIKGRIEHFIARKAMNIDSLGPETVDEYYQQGLIKNVADLYDLQAWQIDANGTRKKSALKIIQGINSSLSVPFERVVFALGIRFVGEVSAKLIARHFKNIDRLMSASTEELCQIDGVGEVMAKSVVNFFAQEENRTIVERLRSRGLKMSIEEADVAASDKLKDQSIVISGVFVHHSRDQYKAIIEQNGGKNVSSISSKTSFILGGSNMGPSKLQKAQSLGVRIVSEDEFLEMIK